MTDHIDRLGDDTRAEDALRTALETQARGVSPYALDGSSIRRAAGRRSTARLAAVAVAVVLLCGGVIGVVQLNHKSTNAPTATSGDVAAPAKGWRLEYYRDVRLQVPKSWRYEEEPGSDWCALPASIIPKRPYVARQEPAGVVLAILCGTTGSPPYNRGLPVRRWVDHVTFRSGSTTASVKKVGRFWVLTRPVGHAVIKVVTADRQLGQRIADSAELVAPSDPSCDPHSDVQSARIERPAPPFDVTRLPGVDSILVCQYLLDVPSNQPGLSAQQELTGAAADRELHALQAAPLGTGPNAPAHCMAGDIGESAITLHLLRHGSDHQMYVYYASCRGNGFDDGTAIRTLTTAACAPLVQPPVQLYLGPRATFERCQPH